MEGIIMGKVKQLSKNANKKREEVRRPLETGSYASGSSIYTGVHGCDAEYNDWISGRNKRPADPAVERIFRKYLM